MQSNAPRRVMGDPGKTETFAFPNYVYIFVFWNDEGTWKIMDTQEIRLIPMSDWEGVRYTGSLMTPGDTIFRYSTKLNIMLAGNGIQGRVYALASPRPLTFSRSLNTIVNLDQLLELKMDLSDDMMQQNLHNIYSTPYNYEVGGKYYGSFENPTEYVIPVDLMLYHVASKVDIKWNVAADKRINKDDPSQAVRLTYMEARRLFNGWSYCFKPMRNEVSSLLASGYDIPDIVTPTDEGLWWEGRTYFYTIPYTVTGEPNYFPLQLRMGTNGTKESAQYYLTLKQPIDTSAVFVPWIRGVFNFNQPLEDKSVTQTIPTTP